MGSGNWIVDNLNSALGTWNGKLAEIWQLLSTTPEEFKGGGVWTVIQGINGALQAIGCALLVLFFVMGIVKTCSSFTELKKPEMVFKCFIRFVLAQAAVTHGMELMTALFKVARGRGLFGEHPPLGHYPAGVVVYLGAVPDHDFNRLFPVFQALSRHGHRAHPHGQLRGTALQQYWRCLSQELRRNLSGGLHYRFSLCDLLGVRLHTACHRGPSYGTMWAN